MDPASENASLIQIRVKESIAEGELLALEVLKASKVNEYLADHSVHNANANGLDSSSSLATYLCSLLQTSFTALTESSRRLADTSAELLRAHGRLEDITSCLANTLKERDAASTAITALLTSYTQGEKGS